MAFIFINSLAIRLHDQPAHVLAQIVKHVLSIRAKTELWLLFRHVVETQPEAWHSWCRLDVRVTEVSGVSLFRNFAITHNPPSV